MRYSSIPQPSNILKPSLIEKVLKLHCHGTRMDDKGNIYALEIWTLNGKSGETWHDLTGYTMRMLKTWLGY